MTTITTQDGKQAQPLGLAAYPHQPSRCVKQAFQRGVNYFFFYGAGQADFIDGLSLLLRRQRDQIIVASGSGARKRATLLTARKKILAALKTDTLDVFFAEYINPSDSAAAIFAADGVLDMLQEWKADRTIRYVGATAHDRVLARQLAADPRVDILMHRFNMAHRKALDEVFPTAAKTRTPVVAFTATRWGTLLDGHPNWTGAAPIAADCYRYCLAQPAVKLVLTAPRTTAELDENLATLAAPKMTARERAHWDHLGDLIYGAGQDRFETEWA